MSLNSTLLIFRLLWVGKVFEVKSTNNSKKYENIGSVYYYNTTNMNNPLPKHSQVNPEVARKT